MSSTRQPDPTKLSGRPEPHWVKATKSMSGSACVELAPVGDCILLRDSKNPSVFLTYSMAEIDAFLDGAKRGEFDHLLSQR